MGDIESRPSNVGKDVFYYVPIGSRYISIPVDENKPKNKVSLGILGEIIKTIPNVSDSDLTKNISEWRKKLEKNLDDSITFDDFNSKSADKQDEIQENLGIGDRLTWNIKVADFLVIRESGKRPDEAGKNTAGKVTKEDRFKDRQEAFSRYLKVIKLSDRKGAPVKMSGGNVADAELTLDGNKTFDPKNDFLVFTEIKNGVLQWKKIPDSSKAQALIGIAGMILDDIGRGNDASDYEYLSKDLALDSAVSNCKEARKALEEEKTNQRDFYAIGQSYITEAKLRVLRRKGYPNIVAEDTNDEVKKLLNTFIKDYDLDVEKTETWAEVDPKTKKAVQKGPETHTIKEWISLNPKVKKYAQFDIDRDKDAVPMAKAGMVYLQLSAELEKAKLVIESDDEKEVWGASGICGQVESLLKTKMLETAGSISGAAKKYIDKTGDYLRFDALVSQADLMTLYGNILGNEQVLHKAYNIYVSIDDQNSKDGICPYQDIQARAVDARESLRYQFELVDYNHVKYLLEKYYDPPKKGKDNVNIMAPFFEGAYQYYKIGLDKAKFLISRNEFETVYPNPELAPLGIPALTDDGKQGVRIEDAKVALMICVDIIANVGSVKATNPKGLIDLKTRAYLLKAQAEARLLKYEDNDDEKLTKVNETITRVEDIIIGLAKDAAGKSRQQILNDEYRALLSNTKRKYREMDYPFYTDLYSEWASLLEQKAWLETKDDREMLKESDIKGNTPLYQGIQKYFDAVNAKLDQVLEIIRTGSQEPRKQIRSNYDKFIRPAAIALQRKNLETFKINIEDKANSINDAGNVLANIDGKINEIEGMKLLGKTLKEIDALRKSPSEKEGVQMVNIGGTDVTKTAVDDLIVAAHSIEAELITKKIFYISKQTVYNADQMKEMIVGDMKKDLGLYGEAKDKVKEAVKRLVDPYFVIQNIIGASMVSMAFIKQDAVKDILGYYNEHLKRSKGSENVRMTYEMCEALAVCAAVNKDEILARTAIRSLDDVIEKATAKLNRGLLPADQKDILSLAYYWKGNMLSWFYNEKSETGDISKLDEAAKCYDKALEYDPNNIPAKVEKENLTLRKANINYKLGLIDNFKSATKNKNITENDKISATDWSNAYEQAVTNLKQIAGISIMGAGLVKPVRKMSGRDVRRREAQYISAQSKAYRIIGSAALTVMCMMEPGKVRIMDLRDEENAADDYYFEARVSKGEVINKEQLNKVNEGRKNQVDKNGTLIFTAENKAADKVNLVTAGAEGAVVTSGSLVRTLGASDKQGLLTAAATWYGEAGKKAIAVRGTPYKLSDLEQMDYLVDEATLSGSSIADKSILAVSIPNAQNMEMINAAIKDIKEKYKDKPLNLLKVRVAEADLRGWLAMASEDSDELKKVADMYKKLKADYLSYGLTMEADTLNNYGEILLLIYYNKERTSAWLNAARAVLKEASETDRSTGGATADIKLANLYIGVASLPTKDEEKKMWYERGGIRALRALYRLTEVGDAEKIKMLFVSEPGRMSLLDKLESNQSLNENEIQAMNSLLRTYVKEVSSREDLKKDKMVIQALCYASQSEAWMYTKKTEQQMIEGEKTLVTKVVASGTYGMRPKAAAPASFLVGGNYLSIMKLLNSVLILAQNEDLKLEDDKNLRRLLNDMSKSGMPTTMRQIRNAYKGACKNNNVTFYEE